MLHIYNIVLEFCEVQELVKSFWGEAQSAWYPDVFLCERLMDVHVVVRAA